MAADKQEIGYGDKEYWDKRYELSTEQYDWFMEYPKFKGALLPHMRVAPKGEDGVAGMRSRGSVKVLMIGCGNARMTQQMYEDGFSQIESVDYCDVAIEQMRALCKSVPELKFSVVDVRDMSCFPNEAFDIIIDKGTLDTVLCASESMRNSGLVLSECSRVLNSKGGVYAAISYGQPQSRLGYMEKSKYKWTVSHELLGESTKPRYMYIMNKGGE